MFDPKVTCDTPGGSNDHQESLLIQSRSGIRLVGRSGKVEGSDWEVNIS